MPIVREAQIQDIHYLINNIREEDREELAALGKTPEASISVGYVNSDRCYSVIDDDGNTIAMFGIGHITNKVCSVWLLASNLVNNHKIYFLRNSKKYYKELTKGYDTSFNMVYAKNTLHIQWLEWLGAKFTKDYIINNEVFRLFHIINRGE